MRGSELLDEALAAIAQEVRDTSHDVLDNLWALDIAEPFVVRGRRRHQALRVDLSQDPQEFLRQISSPHHNPHDDNAPQVALPANIIDRISCSMAFDRISDIEAFLTNCRYLAKMDGSTRYAIGVVLPLSFQNEGSGNTDFVPRVQYWNPENDPRRLMTTAFLQGGTLSPDDIRSQSIMNFVRYLLSKGFTVDRIAECLSYEVIAPDIIIGTVAEVRSKHPELQQQHEEIHDPSLRKIVCHIFGCHDVELWPDDQLVCVPQEYTVVYASGTIPNPLDAQLLAA